MLQDHFLHWGHGIGGGQAQGPGQDHWRPVRAVHLLEAVNTQHGGEVVPLAIGLVLAQVVVVAQPRSVPDTVLQSGDQGGNVTEPEVDSLPRQRMDSVGGVTEEDGPRSNVAVRVTKTKGEGSPVSNS